MIKTYEFFAKNLTNLVKKLYAKKVDQLEFSFILEDLISGQLRRAWLEGMAVNNHDPEEFDAEMQAEVQAIVDNEKQFIVAFGDAIVQARDNEQPIEPLLARAEMWIFRYKDVVNRAILFTAKKRAKFEWQYGDTEHCPTCLELNGKIAFAKEWLDTGILPRHPPNPLLDCGGWKCQCNLVPTRQRRTRGILATLQRIAAQRNTLSFKGGVGSGYFGSRRDPSKPHIGRAGEERGGSYSRNELARRFRQENLTPLLKAKYKAIFKVDYEIQSALRDFVSAGHGAELEDTKFHIKSFDSVLAKMTDDKDYAILSPQEAVDKMKDILRFTIIMPPDNYTDGGTAFLFYMRSRGFNLLNVRNYWNFEDSAYYGVNTWWEWQGVKFEVQFHTPESVAIARANHVYKDIQRSNPERFAEMEAIMVEKWKNVTVPFGILSFPEWMKRIRLSMIDPTKAKAYRYFAHHDIDTGFVDVIYRCRDKSVLGEFVAKRTPYWEKAKYVPDISAVGSDPYDPISEAEVTTLLRLWDVKDTE